MEHCENELPQSSKQPFDFFNNVILASLYYFDVVVLNSIHFLRKITMNKQFNTTDVTFQEHAFFPQNGKIIYSLL